MDTTGLEPANADLEAPVEVGEVDSEPTETEGADPASAAAETGKPEPRDRVQERFDKLTREKYEGLSRAERAEYRAQELERRLAEFEARNTAPTETVAPSTDFPTLESVGWDESKYAIAVSQWNAKVAREAAKAELAAEREAAQRAETNKSWERKQAEFQKAKPEYAEKVIEGAQRGQWALSDEMLEVAQASEIGPEILLYLAENADKSREIYRLPPHLQAREIGRIEARIEAAKAAPPPVVSKAPPPVGRIEAEGTASDVRTTDPSGDKLSDSEWFELERKRLAKLRNR
jgi:hypothetical protein